VCKKQTETAFFALVLLTRNEAFINAPAIRSAGRPLKGALADVQLWTDDFSSLFQVLR
jgi:hypothetical protein